MVLLYVQMQNVPSWTHQKTDNQTEYIGNLTEQTKTRKYAKYVITMLHKKNVLPERWYNGIKKQILQQYTIWAFRNVHPELICKEGRT